MSETEKLAELLRGKGSNGTLVGGVIRDLGLVKIPRQRNGDAGWRYTWWQEPLVKVATVDIDQLKDMLLSGRFMMARNAGKKGFQMLWDHFQLGDNAPAKGEKASPRYYAFMLEEYKNAKAKQSGNLHERMKLANDLKDELLGLLEPIFPFCSDVGSTAHDLFVAIMDLETEVSQYPVRKTGKGTKGRQP